MAAKCLLFLIPAETAGSWGNRELRAVEFPLGKKINVWIYLEGMSPGSAHVVKPNENIALYATAACWLPSRCQMEPCASPRRNVPYNYGCVEDDVGGYCFGSEYKCQTSFTKDDQAKLCYQGKF